MTVKSAIYAGLRVSNDINAIRRGPRAMGRRMQRRILGRFFGRLIGKIVR